MAHGELPPLNITSGAIRFNTDSMKLEYFRIGMEGGATSSYAGIGTMAAGEWVQLTTDSPDIQTGGTRGVIGAGYANPGVNITTIDFVTISTTGNATDYGDLTDARASHTALSSRTRAVFACGYSPGDVNTIDFITIASGGTGTVFGENTASGNNGARYAPAGLSNSTRGLIGGGQSVPGATMYTDITYITIAQTGNSVDFGDLNTGGSDGGACSNSTRGIFAGGSPSPGHNVMDFVTINTLGNATDFGDLNGSNNRKSHGGGASATRGIFGGFGPTASNAIDYITIPTLGNALDFGNLTTTLKHGAACSSVNRCIWSGGYRGGSKSDTIDYIQIQTLGDAIDFGDLTDDPHYHAACSNGHGGLG